MRKKEKAAQLKVEIIFVMMSSKDKLQNSKHQEVS